MFTKDEFVAVCYDSKWSRAVKGQVTSVGPLCKKIPEWIIVRFVPWASESTDKVEMLCLPKFNKQKFCYFGGWLKGEGEVGIMRGLGCEGDWYSIFPRQELLNEGYDYEER